MRHSVKLEHIASSPPRQRALRLWLRKPLLSHCQQVTCGGGSCPFAFTMPFRFYSEALLYRGLVPRNIHSVYGTDFSGKTDKEKKKSFPINQWIACLANMVKSYWCSLESQKSKTSSHHITYTCGATRDTCRYSSRAVTAEVNRTNQAINAAT